jgi:MFS family permease
MLNILLLGFTSLFTDIASEMVYPLLPFFLVSSLGASPAILGLIEGIAESIASVLKVFSGYISDRLGRRKSLTIVGYSASIAGKLLLYLAGGWGTVLAGRSVDRLGKGIRTAPRDALIAESSRAGRRGTSFGLHRAMDTAGAATGVVIAYVLLTASPGNYTRVFLWSLFPATAGVLILLFVRESHTRVLNKTAMPALRWRMLPRKLRMFLLVALVFSLGNSSNTFLLLRAGSGDVNPARTLLLYLAYTLSFAGFSYPAGRLSDFIGRKTILVAGYLMFGLVYAGFAFISPAGGGWSYWVLFILYGVYSAFTEGIEKAFVIDLAPGEFRATAIGLHATLVGISLLPASLLAGQLWSLFGPETALGLGAITGTAAAVALALLL